MVLLFVVAPLEAMAASRTVKIYTVNADYVRVHSTAQQGDNVIAKTRRGSKVFYLGKSGNWWRVRTDRGVTGYMYKDYLTYYGATTLNRVYQANASSVKVYKRAYAGSSRVATLSKNEHVVVYSVSGNWAYVATMSGKTGYVRKSALKKAS